MGRGCRGSSLKAATWRHPALLVVTMTVLLLGGCAQQRKPMYQWDGYQRQVYEYLKGDGTGHAEQLGVMLAQAEKVRASGQTLPPGFRAHVGMLHLQLGNLDEARRGFEAEKAAFPESVPFMDFLLKRMNAQPVATGAAPGAAV